MGKMKLLLDVVSDLRSLADSLQAVADAVTQNEMTEEPPKEETGKKKPAEKSEPQNQEESVPAEQPLTLEAVRAVLAEKSRTGHTAEVKALLTKHGGDKLSDIDPAKYQVLLADAEVL